MRKRMPNLKVIGMTADFTTGVFGSDNKKYYLVKSKFKTDSLEVPEISIPTIWTKSDIEGCNGCATKISQLIGALFENTQNSLGDLIEMHRGDGMWASCYDEDGNWKETTDDE